MSAIIENAIAKAAAKKNHINTIKELSAKHDEAVRAAGGRTVTKIKGIDIPGYKLLFVPASEIMPAYFANLKSYNEAASKANEASRLLRAGKITRPEFDNAKAVLLAEFGKLQQEMQASRLVCRPFLINEEACLARTNRRSLASDIAGVTYGPIVDRNIIMLHHDTFNQVKYSWLLGQSADDSKKLVSNMIKNMIFLLQRNGVKIINENTGEEYEYAFWASTSSHQKKGIAYFGEINMMKRTEELRSFGATFEQINQAGGDNGAEYIKRQAILFTPSEPIDITFDQVLMLPSVSRASEVDNVAEVDLTNGEIEIGRNTIDETLGDGESYFIDDTPSAQIRGYGIKSFAAQVKNVFNSLDIPELVKDVDGAMRDPRNYRMLTTTDSWKANKLGYTWAQFVEKANELSKQCPTLNHLRVVRYASSAKEKTRFLSRQSTQQWIFATDEQLDKLCSASKRQLKQEKHLGYWLIQEAGLLNDEQRPSELAYQKRPDILASEKVRPAIKNMFDRDKAKAAANRIRVHGQYPYLVHDPVAMLQILLCGKDANDLDLGILKPGEINAPNLNNGQSVYFVRYPNNFLCGMVLTNVNNAVFNSLGDVAVLPVTGHEITRADGDFDGDEGLIVTDMVVVNMMKEVIKKINPPLIKFAHSKAARHEASAYKQMADVAEALYNGQAYNKVGQYSNIAMKLMSSYKGGEFLGEKGVGLDVMRAHVATILVIDMVKTGTFPEGLQRVIDAAAKDLTTPYSQKYIDIVKGIDVSEREYEAPGSNTPDRIAAKIVEAAGEFEYDTDGVMFDPDTLLAEIPECVKARRVPMSVIPSELFQKLSAFNVSAYHPLIERMRNGEPVGAKEVLVYFFNNRIAFRSAMADAVGAEKDELAQIDDEYYALVREFVMSMGDAEYWLQIPEDVRRRIVYNYVIKDAFELEWSNGLGTNGDQETTELVKAFYAKFIVDVFAPDIIEYAKEYSDAAVDSFDIDGAIAEMSDFAEEE